MLIHIVSIFRKNFIQRGRCNTKLLLSGGGNPEQVKALDEFFADYVNGGKVLYIPVAMDDIPYEECLKWFKSVYEKYGITKIDMCTNLYECNNLNNYKAIFIGGGNTFKLLKEIKESNFDKRLIEYLNNDGFVYGGSAGAIIFGYSIDTAAYADENKVSLKDLSGLNLLSDYRIWPHYDGVNGMDELMSINGKIIALYEESGLFYDGNKLSIVGKPYVEFNNLEKE